jgi:methionyl-tRNA formyltransferase
MLPVFLGNSATRASLGGQVLEDSDRIRIVFFGTPEYAVPTLRVLATESRFDLMLAVTQPDRKAGRGHHLLSPPVKTAANELGVPLVQPTTLRDESVREHLRSLDADLFVVAAYGLIFSKPILDIPRHTLAFLQRMKAVGGLTPKEGYAPLSPGALRRAVRATDAEHGGRITWHIVYGRINAPDAKASSPSTMPA